MKTIAIALLSASLVACAATSDLNTSGTLSTADQAVVRSLAERASEVCVTYTHRDDTAKTPVSGQMTANKMPEVKRFYRSGGDWVKAELVINSVWGNVYFDPRTSRMACGDDSWQKFGESRSLSFDEVMPAKAS